VSPDILPTLLSNVWSIFLVVLFFGGSIFVHELGHFLAARRRGVHVERFSIGFGPKIFSWKGKDGVEYRISWLPLGGYVTLPQLADLRGIEGDSDVDVDKLPPITYGTKMLVFVAGAAFNILFALALATVIWFAGQPASSMSASTRIGYVSPTLTMPDNSKVVSPAAEAGLQIGDTIVAIDGYQINEWMDIVQTIVTGSDRTAAGNPKTIFTIDRFGEILTIAVYPRLSGDEKFRRVGIDAGYELIVTGVTEGSTAEKAGFQAKDEIRTLNGQLVINAGVYQNIIADSKGAPITAVVLRDGKSTQFTIPERTGDAIEAPLGIGLTTGFSRTYPSPFKQIANHAVMTVRTLGSLIHPSSDIGLSKLSGPVGIFRIFHNAAEAGFITILMFTILINVNLAIFNLLPIPVLDGGQMLFATIAKIRGRTLPINFIMATQSTFVILLFSMIIYVSFFDVRRIVRDNLPNDPAPQEEAAE